MTAHSQHPDEVPTGRTPAATAVQPAGVPGGLIVMALLLLAIGLGVFAVWFQRDQTRRCLAFYGPEAARRIQSAPRVELWQLEARGEGVRAVARRDVSRGPGLVHLRRGLIEDFNYAWEQPGEGAARPLAGEAWDRALVFHDGRAATGTIVAFDLDDAGAATVVGRPGRVGLGRLRAGLAAWLDEAWRAAAGEESDDAPDAGGK
ncbi:MAG: hypothetical protein O3C39_09480 [Planctomycetota bacterium]|jgi:hypothetical protein|nr:hypothetical protein [Planctomycetota bacterium]MDA1201901.1 hypothetical protein [Planctomycetota bacterium]